MVIDENNERKPSNGSSGLGIAGLVLGIVAAVVAFIPCFGMYAIYPGIIGVVLSGISIYLANKTQAAKGMAIAGLVCALVGCSIAGYQYYIINKGMEVLDKSLKENGSLDSLRKNIEEMNKNGELDSLKKGMDELKEVQDSINELSDK